MIYLSSSSYIGLCIPPMMYRCLTFPSFLNNRLSVRWTLLYYNLALLSASCPKDLGVFTTCLMWLLISIPGNYKWTHDHLSRTQKVLELATAKEMYLHLRHGLVPLVQYWQSTRKWNKIYYSLKLRIRIFRIFSCHFSTHLYSFAFRSNTVAKKSAPWYLQE